MDGGEQMRIRDANGRFMPGQSGNPAGKKAGTRNRATVLREALADGEDIATARIVIDKALAGDPVAARFIVDRLTPRPRGRAIALDLPDGARARDIVAAFDATVRAMAAGEITPDEAVQVTRVLDGRRKAIEAARREGARGGRAATLKSSRSGPFGKGLAGERVVDNPHGAANTPHPSGASAPGPSLSREGRGVLPRDHLHFPCILQSPAAVRDGGATAA